MADFYSVHRRAIDRAGAVPEREFFRIVAWEPLSWPTEAPESDTATIITFRRTKSGYEPAGPGDARAVADWNERHKDAPASVFEFKC
jgi:hypothetical protein